MKRSIRICFAIWILILCIFQIPVAEIFLTETVLADAGGFSGGQMRLVDAADLLTESEKSSLLAELDEVSRRQKMDIVVVTAESLQGYTAQEYADDFYDYGGYGYGAGKDGILLLVSMEERDWWISTCGYGISVFTDAGIEYLSEQFLGDLSDGEYASAFHTFVSQCDAFITQAREDEPYDRENPPRAPLSLIWIPAAFASGLVLALLVVAVMKSRLKTVRSQAAAGSYIREGSMHITENREFFLYRNVHRTAKPKQNHSSGSSVHTSSSGTTHGGGGGKF